GADTRLRRHPVPRHPDDALHRHDGDAAVDRLVAGASPAPYLSSYLKAGRMRQIQLLTKVPNLPFMPLRNVGLAIAAIICVATAVLVGVGHLNFGIDFRGGILMEVRTNGPADLSAMRVKVGAAEVGE